jgi:hypothetical protein
MSNRKEAVFSINDGPNTVWLDDNPSQHRKNHFNYSQNTFTVIAYLMQRFELTQEGSRKVLAILFQQLEVTTTIPSQATTSRELKKYKRVLHGWKYIVINSEGKENTESVSASYKEPSNQYGKAVTIVGDQSEHFTIFKFNGKQINLKRVAKVKTAPPHDKIILECSKETKANDYSALVARWLRLNSALVKQTNYLTELDGSKLFDALIPLMPKLKDKTKRLTTEEYYSQLTSQPNKKEHINNALLKAGTIDKKPSKAGHINAQVVLFKYHSSEIKVDVYRLAIWIFCPYSKLNFIRLNSTEFVDKNTFDKLNINKEEVDRYTPIEVKGKVFNLKLLKTNNRLKFHLALIDEETFWDWSSYLTLSIPEKNKAVTKQVNEPEDWSYETQYTCVGEKVVKDKEIMMARKQPLNSFIVNFVLGDKKAFSKNSFTKHLKTWASYLNETSHQSPEDLKTYQKNKHILSVSD